MRLLACVKCGRVIRVHEEPVEFIDPKLFVGGCCLEPSEQLELGVRARTAAYLETAKVPF